ncbi:MAG: hypothetical protein HY721_06660 [Planctomycetes bacterium]|nr:hypothetical protein [Planctomycetota bacterium]
MPAPHSVTLAGAGNIGSHAAPLLARMQRLFYLLDIPAHAIVGDVLHGTGRRARSYRFLSLEGSA